MSDSTKQERIEELLRKSLLGEELVNTQFHLFSARSLPSRRAVRPRVLCANNVLLAKSSKYFLDLLGSDVNPSDPSLIDLIDDHDVPHNVPVDEYGYGSDSDLDDCHDPVGEAPPQRRSGTSHKAARHRDDDDSSDDESVSSDMFVMSPEQPSMDELFPIAGSVASSDTAVQQGRSNKPLPNHAAMRLRSLASRHVLVRDTAFQTWYTLLNYLYMHTFNFSPLGSATPDGQPKASSTSALDEPRCSAKSMYRLACKVGLDDLRDEAFSFIRNSLSEHNILRELSCSLLSRHPALLEMELDVLYAHIGSPQVVAHFPALARRIAHNELAHGADILVGIHTRLLKETCPLPMQPSPVALNSVWRQRERASGWGAEDGDETQSVVGVSPPPSSPIQLPSGSGVDPSGVVELPPPLADAAPRVPAVGQGGMSKRRPQKPASTTTVPQLGLSPSPAPQPVPAPTLIAPASEAKTLTSARGAEPAKPAPNYALGFGAKAPANSRGFFS